MKNKLNLIIILSSFLFTLSAFGEVKIKTSAAKVDNQKNPDNNQITITRPMVGETIKWQVISSGGNTGTSTAYELSSTVGQTATGKGTSPSYILGHGYWQVFETSSGTCCVGQTGNVDCSGEEQPDISDITRLIDYLYLSHGALCCAEEADVDKSGGEPDISDITYLIDHLYLSHKALPDCP